MKEIWQGSTIFNPDTPGMKARATCRKRIQGSYFPGQKFITDARRSTMSLLLCKLPPFTEVDKSSEAPDTITPLDSPLAELWVSWGSVSVPSSPCGQMILSPSPSRKDYPLLREILRPRLNPPQDLSNVKRGPVHPSGVRTEYLLWMLIPSKSGYSKSGLKSRPGLPTGRTTQYERTEFYGPYYPFRKFWACGSV
ncbi:uncharacterized protein BDR25DRAFT_351513 [Lindgomyces ingoldianus]|uniref:Uncharacterized protein n=1 Tax=Lindgomyces ingoldianus TaxID=673940 RepID=A0ACB6R8G0_9PLEO|nr:uncharacterized protein BDR25DRAFT_351513 [Lindgomyces ingoldianus]KAF2475030.1 hypothetical protein BDR25DRAFT_351513 [Lindgomyces ingoldianus]